MPIFCLFVQIAFIWVISVERLIKITKVTPYSVLSLNLNNGDHQKRYQTYKISAACWLFGILVAIPTLIIYDIVYVLIENGSVAHKFSEANNSFFSIKYYLERDGCQSAIFYKEKNTSLLYKYNSTVESAKRALSNILFNISSKGSLNNPLAKCWNPKLRYLIPHLVNVDRSPMYFFKALDFIPYGLIQSNKHERDIDRDFFLIEGPNELPNGSSSSVHSWVGDYEFSIDCTYVTSHKIIIVYSVFLLTFVFLLPTVSMLANYTFVSRFLIKRSLDYRHRKWYSFVKMMLLINNFSSNNLTHKKRVDLYIIPTNTSNDRLENNLRRASEPCTSKLGIRKISLNEMALIHAVLEQISIKIGMT
ncbi:unnamed protein product [Gordionus sp. m RMFG-2023]